MRTKTSLWIAGAAIVVVAAGGYFLTQQKSGPVAGKADFATAATPVGVTIQRINEKTNMYVSAGTREVAYGDAKGMTLYTFDKDVDAGKSACMDDCAKAWPPLAAPADAKPVGAWSVVAREDGTKQWARMGKPLYTFAKEAKPGENKGEGAASGIWHTAKYKPSAEINLPYGMIGVEEVAEANGQALVDNRGITLYAFQGQPDQDQQPACSTGVCSNHFTPVAAPVLVKPTGDFTLVSRKDGTKQWAYKGRALYTYDGDAVRGDVNGIDADPRWQVAVLQRYFMPAEVSVHRTAQKGNILTTAQGLTLYRREGYSYPSVGNGLHRAIPTRPAVGRSIGWQSCVDDCVKTWRPLKAPADAQASGYWEVAARDDGTKQWVYQGYPMYTYSGDKNPGEMTGNDMYDYFISEDPTKVAYAGIQFPGAGALFWTYTSP